MRRILLGIVAIAATAPVCFPQEPVRQQVESERRLVDEMEKLKAAVAKSTVMGVSGGIMGPAVKGAPYSGLEVNESTQMLADGTRIHQEHQTMVFRDSEGRVRRETPDEITIWDPVANTSYVIDPKAQTARKSPLAIRITSATTGPQNVRFYRQTIDTAVPPPGPHPPPPAPEGRSEALQAASGERQAAFFNFSGQRVVLSLNAGGPFSLEAGEARGASESLGKQTIEGVNAEGTRNTSTLDAGVIGNDRPIRTINERWYSLELQTLIRSSHTDPRTGDESFRLTGISRTEPASYLFQVPAGYQILNQ